MMKNVYSATSACKCTGWVKEKKNKMFKNFGNRYFQVHIRNQLQKISNSSPNTTIFG